MVIVSLLTMVTGAVVPPDWFAEAPPAPAASSVVDERVTTLGYVAGKEFARVSVIWVEVDGARVTEDAWGQGQVDTIRFKVGIKRAEGNALLLGDRTVVLSPTDVFTIRGFDGRYSFADVASAAATISLDGTVKNTVVNSASVGGVLTTKGTSRGSLGGAPERLAYVELGSGQPVSTLEVASGGAKKLTTVGAGAVPTAAGATAVDVRWVKLDDALVTGYTYGEGELPRISFAPDTRFRSQLNFSGLGLTFSEGDRVEIRDFLGAWSVVMRPGGGARLRLDGWAANADVLSGTQTLNSNPALAFSYTPQSPSTRDIVHFSADARDSDGTVVEYVWTFLRKIPQDATAHTLADVQTAVARGPTAEHRFTRPGTWEVTLRVVDDQGAATTVVQDITVANSAPVVAFDWFPSAPITREQVRFFDRSSDLDGGVVARLWNFGDGRTSQDAEPTHSYQLNGIYNVTLTVTDVNGGRETKTKIIAVRNALPDCAFVLDPPNPTAFQQVTLVDRSSDREGPVAAWNWTVRNLVNASVPVARYTVQNPVHTFTRADVHRIELRVTDADGETSTCSQDVGIANTAPIASFTIWPLNPRTGELVHLNSTSTDPDGRIVATNWTIEGDPEVKRGTRIGYTFRRAASFQVTMQVTDNGGRSSGMTQTVHIDNSPPIADFVFTPSAPKTGEEVRFTNVSRDPDGDRITRIEWDFGPGENPRTAEGNAVRHTFATNGVHNVTMRATDSGGRTSEVTRPVLVLNRLPTGVASYTAPAIVFENTTFTVDATDPDGTVVSYTWLFGDGGTRSGQTVQYAFQSTGRFQVKVVLTDDDGGSNDVPLTVDVGRAGPVADFTVNPAVAPVGRTTTFTDATVARGAALTAWEWDFGDNSPKSTLQNPTHVYTRKGTFIVKLKVTDADGAVGETQRTVLSTNPPVAAFTLTPTSVRSGGLVQLVDTSTDDGEIAARLWRVDGVEASTAKEWERAFSGRGKHLVQLVVTDNHGVSSTKYDNVTVLNEEPVADFVAETTPILRGQPARFVSTSTDVDGAISTYKWFVFDSPVLSASADPSVLEFVFQNTGRYPVRLQVTDDSGAMRTVTKSFDVYADVDATYRVLVRYSDGTPAPLDGLDVQITDQTTSRVYRLGQEIVALPEDSAFALTLQAGTWRAGTPYTLTVIRPTGSASVPFNSQTDDLASRGRVIHYVIVTRPLDTPVLQVQNGVEPGQGTLPGLLDLTVPADPGVYYASQQERFRGTVTAFWKVARAPAEGAFVQVWANRTATRDVDLLPRSSGSVLECPVLLCVKVTGTLDENGRFAFELPAMTTSTGTGLQTNPAGWYVVETRVSWPTPAPTASVPPVSARTKVFVDVEGLLQRVFGTSLP